LRKFPEAASKFLEATSRALSTGTKGTDEKALAADGFADGAGDGQGALGAVVHMMFNTFQ
jgi:hypothetical protein